MSSLVDNVKEVVHFKVPIGPKTRCGIDFITFKPLTTFKPRNVTCGNCIKFLRADLKAAEEKKIKRGE